MKLILYHIALFYTGDLTPIFRQCNESNFTLSSPVSDSKPLIYPSCLVLDPSGINYKAVSMLEAGTFLVSSGHK